MPGINCDIPSIERQLYVLNMVETWFASRPGSMPVYVPVCLGENAEYLAGVLHASGFSVEIEGNSRVTARATAREALASGTLVMPTLVVTMRMDT